MISLPATSKARIVHRGKIDYPDELGRCLHKRSIDKSQRMTCSNGNLWVSVYTWLSIITHIWRVPHFFIRRSLELFNVAEHAGIRHNLQHIQKKEEGDESSLGSLIDAIEADFGGQQYMANYHQSAPCLSAVPLYTEDDPEHENSLRFSPDADALLSMTSENSGKHAPVGSKSSRKASIGKDSNNASMGTLSTENSTLSTSFEDAVMDLFTALKPQPDNPSTLNPPSQHDRTDPPKQGKNALDSPKKKRNTRRKEPASVASDDSQWLELVLSEDPKNTAGDQSTVGQSTVGGVKAYKTDASGTINSMNSEEVHAKMKEGLLGKSLSALDVEDFLSPAKKKDFLRATTHCSPTQVSKHTGLSALSAHTGTNSSGRSNSSAYLLERLPLNPPIACDEGETNAKKTKKSSTTRRKSKKGSDASLDESVEVFQGVKPKQEEPSPAPAIAQESVDSKEVSSSSARSPRRGKKPGKIDEDGLSTTLAQISPLATGKEITKRTSKASDATLQSIEIFSPAEGTKPAFDDVSTAVDAVLTNTTDPAPSSDVTTAGSTFLSVRDGSRQKQSSKTQPLDAKKSTPLMSDSAYSEGTSQVSSSSPRKNPPARPWSGRSSFTDDSLVSSIKGLSEGQVEEESMLNMLITSLKKDQSDVTKSDDFQRHEDYDQNQQENAAALSDDNITKRPMLEGEQKTSKKDKKIDATKQTKSPKTGKKQARKIKSTRPLKSEADEHVDATTDSPSPPPKTPQSQKTQKGQRRTIDASEISAPPLTTPREKAPKGSKADTSGVKEAPLLSEDTSPRRRLRARKSAEDGNGTVSKGNKSPARVRPAIGDAKTSGKKTPTRVRPSTGDPAEPNGTTPRRKKTPTRLRPGSEDVAVVRKKTPTRVRNPIEDATTSEENKTPTRARPKLTEVGDTSVGNRTPTRTRGDGGFASVGKRTPTRVRPAVENGSTPVRRKTPTRLRSRLDDGSGTQGKKTPPRVRPGLDVSGEAPTWIIPGFESKNKDSQRQNTPTKLRAPAQPEPPCRIQSPVKPNAKLTEDGSDYTSSPVPSKERLAPDPPAATHGLAQPSKILAATHNVGDANRHSTPTRVRRMFDAAAERVASACRTPPRERASTAQSPAREGRPMRERSFSPFSRLRLLGSRTPPRQRLIDESDQRGGTRTPTRRVSSQSPPKERPVQLGSDTLSSVPVEQAIEEQSTQKNNDSLSSLPQRPTSRGRRRSSGSLPRKSDESFETAVSHIRQNSIGSQNSLASKTKTPTLLKRKIGIDQSTGSSETDAKPTRTKTPTRVRRGSRGNPAEGETPKKEGQPTGRVSIRPRRRGGPVGGDRESSSGIAISERTTLTTSNEDSTRKVRRRTPTRGRQPTRPQTPTKSRKTRPVVTRGSSDRQVRAPDPPGVNKSKLRSQSASRTGRSNSQPRSRNGEHPVDGHPLADFFD